MRPEKSETAVGLQRFRERGDTDSATGPHRTLEEVQASVALRKLPKVFIPRKWHCGEFLLYTGAGMAQLPCKAFEDSAFEDMILR